MSRVSRPDSCRVAILGLGKIARDQHVPAVLACSRFTLAATVDPVNALPGVRGFASLDALIADGPDIDAVVICTPPLIRAGLARRAIARHWHVMLEKPPAATVTQAEILAAEARAAGVTLYASWHSRMSRTVASARAWLSRRRPTGITIEWRENIREWHPGQDWLLGPGGFGVFDPAINALSIATEILPVPLEVIGAEMTLPLGRQAPIAARLGLRAGDASGEADLDFLHEGEPRWTISIQTADGALVLREGGRVLEIPDRIQVCDGKEYPRLYEAFAAHVAAGRGEVDLSPMKLVADAYMLAERRDGPAFEWISAADHGQPASDIIRRP